MYTALINNYNEYSKKKLNEIVDNSHLSYMHYKF